MPGSFLLGEVPLRAGEMAELGKCLPGQHEDSKAHPLHPAEKLGLLAKACYSRAGEAEARGWLDLAGQSA